jgi:2-keto-4-pentenoate hydratase/2-oxohepta-3-ene-1,7-dioic acid hydratase in catechol pathway
MRLVTFEARGEERLGAECHDRIVDLQNAYCVNVLRHAGAAAAARAAAEFPPDMLAYLRSPQTAQSAREAFQFASELPGAVWDGLEGQSSILYRPEQVRLLAPVPRPPKVICLGLNYRDHAAESGMPVPQEPIVFSKYPSAVIGPKAPIRLPPNSQEVDYEAELVFVIGKEGRNVREAEALGYVAGYTCGNDVSARDYQLRRGGGQWMIGKTFDTFAPTGPALVTPDEVGDPHQLGIRCLVNGTTLQNGSTEQLIFSVPQTIAYLSHVFTLEVGDLVFTGTPPGVGFARKPPVFLKPGDEVEIQIDKIGALRNPVVAGAD